MLEQIERPLMGKMKRVLYAPIAAIGAGTISLTGVFFLCLLSSGCVHYAVTGPVVAASAVVMHKGYYCNRSRYAASKDGSSVYFVEMKVPYKTHLKKAEEMDAIVSPISAVPGHDPSRNYIYRLFKAKAGSKSGKLLMEWRVKDVAHPWDPSPLVMIRNFLESEAADQTGEYRMAGKRVDAQTLKNAVREKVLADINSGN